MTGEFHVYFWCRICPAVCETLTVYSHPLHIWMSTFPTYEDIPRVMLFGTLGKQKKTLSKGTFSYILTLARAKASRQCRDATQTGCRISRTLRVGHGVHGSGIEEVGKKHRRGQRRNEHIEQLGHTSDRVFRFSMSEQINLTRAVGISNDSGTDILSAPRPSNTNLRIQ